MVQLAHNSIPLPVLTSEKSHSLPHLFPREHNPGASTVPQEFNDVFVDDLQLGGAARVEPVEIDTGNAKPIRCAPRRLTPAQEQAARELVAKLWKAKVIRPSKSRWCAPVVLVTKKDGGMRLCVDYRRLNEVTHVDAYPLPRIDETLDRLSGAKYFTLLDLASGYWQLPIREEDVEKTVFSILGRLWESPVLPMGMCNAPPAFQRVMNNVFCEMLNEEVMVYIDDLIVYHAHGRNIRGSCGRWQRQCEGST